MNHHFPGKKWFPLGLLLTLLILAAACRKDAVTPTATVQIAGSVTPATATATIPPVHTPTIPLPPTPTAAEPTAVAVVTPVDVEVKLGERPRFARFEEQPVDTVPVIYHEPIAADLNNVIVPFTLSDAQRARLAESGFVVSPGQEKEFYTVYEKARYDNLPIFITSDSVLHIYHLLFDKVLRTAEVEYFIPLLVDLNRSMLDQMDRQYQQLAGTSWEEAARRSVAFVGVASVLLDPAVEVPAYAADLVEAELALIEDAGGIMESPIFPRLPAGEDYTQYIPRGHYTRSEALSNYFRSMMWYGRMSFRLMPDEPEIGRAETRIALLLVHALRNAGVREGQALDAWLDLYNPTVFFVGRSDDLTAPQYIDVIDAVYGPNPELATLADDTKLDVFIAEANQLPPPMILGMVIYDTDDVEATTKGFRFMGQRFVPDAYIFRQLIYRNVGTRDNRRGLPMGLDIMAAMGSERAYNILEELGETEYANYPQQMEKVRAWVSDLSTDDWTETLYTTWLYTFQPLIEPPGDGYPQFMLSDAWLDKQLNSSLGSWAELKHDTILYAKQVYAELGGGGDVPSPKPALGYVEPVPAFYARLLALTEMTYQGLDSRGLLADQDRNSLERLSSVIGALQTMAEKELRGEPLSDEEYDFIRFFGGELEHLTMAAADTDEETTVPTLEEEQQAAVVADVATDPYGVLDGVLQPVVLEEAVGRINEIYAVVPMIADDGSVYLQVAKGGVFSYYEFPWPASDRLTDEKWRQMLAEGEAPSLPVWTASFFEPESAHDQFQRAIYGFQRSLTEGYWYLTADWLPASEDVKAQFAATFNDLLAANQYIGHQWINAAYRSVDIQADDRVVVTLRETWQDTLYNRSGGSPSYGDQVTGRRGPYTLDVTYTLEKPGDYWQVSRVVYGNEPPAWQ